MLSPHNRFACSFGSYITFISNLLLYLIQYAAVRENWMTFSGLSVNDSVLSWVL